MSESPPPPSPSDLPPVAPISQETARLVALLERMAGEYTGGAGSQTAALAREEFVRATGRVHEGDHSFDERMAQFMEWFLLDRPDPDTGVTPCERWAAEHAANLDPGDRARLLALATSHRSAFTPAGREVAGGWLVLDLLYGFQWVVAVDAPLPGLDPGDVFEGRLAAPRAEVHFTGAFCYHPPEVAARIRRHLERVAHTGRRHESVLDHLMAMRLAYDRAEGVPAHRIYRFGATRGP